MIIVLGIAEVAEGNLPQALELSDAHVARSLSERGCLAHAVFVDRKNPQKLVFVEEWESKAALLHHFAVPESGQFVRALASLLSSKPRMRLFEANEVAIP